MASSPRSPRDLLTPAALQILLSLAGRDLHGYGIKQDVEARTDGALNLGPGTLYEAIHRMEADEWIQEVDSEGDARKRVYRITSKGSAILQEELRRLDGIVRYARAERLLPEGEH